MRYLIDTHTLIWYLAGDSTLSSKARDLIDEQENSIYVSAASLWEMAIKFSIGKLDLRMSFEEMFPEQLEKNSVEILGADIVHFKTLVLLPFHHRDPFDRLIIAQSKVEGLPIVSIDGVFDDYGVERIWT
jgi:PIN domain nuclease of toxin-antitoxin system